MSRRLSRGLIHHVRSISTMLVKRSPVPGLVISEEVEHALQHGRPVVALETAILTHGMPHPTNIETCLLVERRVRESGAIPATIGILRGRVHVGLSKELLVELAEAKPSVKVSRRDIAVACACKAYGGTTIAGTMVLAHLAGIRVFATGGLGGVHRGGEASMDVSADLTELGRTPVAVVASGPKSILDIGRTLEYLETQGVPVISYSKTKDFPSFFTPKSGFKSPWNATSPREAAQIICHGVELGMTNGYFFGVPIPEAYEALGAELQLSVEQAIKESEENGISKSGKDATPWLLNRIRELTDGRSLESNIALIENTARVGGSIAVEYAKLLKGESENVSLVHPVTGSSPTASSPTSEELPPAKLAVIGIAAVDIIAKAETNNSGSVLQTTAKGAVCNSLGGVGRNVAEAAHRSLPSVPNSEVLLISPVGQDQFAAQIQAHMDNIGMRTDGLVQITAGRTAVINMVLLGDGSLLGGVADVAIADKISSKEIIAIMERHTLEAIALDANLSPELMAEVCLWAQNKKIPVYYEPTSVQKSLGILPVVRGLIKAQALSTQPGIFAPSPIYFISPNRFELEALWAALQEQSAEVDAWKWEAIEDACIGREWRESLEKLAKSCDLKWLLEDGVALQMVNLLPFFQNIVLKCGEQGVLVGIRAPLRLSNLPESNVKGRVVVSNGRTSTFMLKHFPAQRISGGDIVNVTGAGDTLTGSLLASLMTEGSAFFEGDIKLARAIDNAQKAACATLKCVEAVSPDIRRLA